MRFARLIALSLAAFSTVASAQSYPDRPIRMYIGFSGGVLDSSSRLIGDNMSKRFGQPIIVEPLNGASGLIAAQAVVKAKPDGYTLLYGATSGFTAVFMRNNVIAADTAFAPVSLVAVTPYLLMVNAKLPIRSVAELVAYTKANPGKLNFGAPAGSTTLLGALLASRSGADYVAIPYTGHNGTLAAMLAGDIGVSVGAAGSYTPSIRSGAIRPLLVLSPKRISQMPDVPTANELGLNMTGGTNFGLWAPLGTPREIVQKLNEAVVAAVRTPEIAKILQGEGANLELPASTPEELLVAYREEVKTLAEAARIANFQPQ